MSKFPAVALIAALVIATTATILIRVLPVAQLAAPPLVTPDTTFTVAEGTYAVYYYSGTSVSVSSNVTADFGLLSLTGLPVVSLSRPLPPNIIIHFVYYDPLKKTYADIYLYNDTATGKTYYKNSWPATDLSCWPDDMPNDFPAAVVRLEDKVVLYPDIASMNWVARADGDNVYYYNSNGNLVAQCGYQVRYTSTTGYSQSFDNTPYTYLLPDGSTIAIAVRPFIIAAVKPSANAQVTISAS